MAIHFARSLHRRYWLLRDRFQRKPVGTAVTGLVLGYVLLNLIPLVFVAMLAALPFCAFFGFFFFVVKRTVKEPPAPIPQRPQTMAPPPVPKVTSRARQRQELLDKWEAFRAQLSPAAAERYDRLRQTVRRLGSLFPPGEHEKASLLRPGEYPLWLYLKLLLARDHLEVNARESREEDLRTQLAALEAELEQPDLTPAARESKQETAILLRQRIASAEARRARLQEVESDLTRIEHKIALLYDQAVQQNSMNDAGLRVNLPAEAMDLRSLSPSAGGGMEEVDRLMTEQLSAH